MSYGSVLYSIHSTHNAFTYDKRPHKISVGNKVINCHLPHGLWIISII